MALLRDTLYPLFGYHQLRAQRGERWAELIDSLSSMRPNDVEFMAYVQMMRRLRREVGLEFHICEDPTCAVCATDILVHFRGSEDELLQLYHNNLDEIKLTFKLMKKRRVARQPLSVPAPAATSEVIEIA